MIQERLTDLALAFQMDYPRQTGILFYFLSCIWVCCLLLCICTMCMHAGGGQKTVLDPLRLELQMVVSHVGAGKRAQIYFKSCQGA